MNEGSAEILNRPRPECFGRNTSPSVEVDSLVVKIASRCNMDCDYCYIYHHQDDSWQNMPQTMSDETVNALIENVSLLYERQHQKPLVVFHGGEPLLFGVRRFRSLVEKFVSRIPDVRLSIQTNGTIYNEQLEKLLVEFRDFLTFSLSVDGFREENDRHRLGLKGQSVFKKIEKTIRKSRQSGLLDNILIVVDTKNDPSKIFAFMVDAGAQTYNLILQDGDRKNLPPGKEALNSTEVGEWLTKLFYIYAQSDLKFRIQMFDEMVVGLLKKQRSVACPPVTHLSCTMTIDTDGEIKQTDTFRVNANNADQITGSNVTTHSIFDSANSQQNIDFVLSTSSLVRDCRDCAYLNVCGGGYEQHRFDGVSYRNPSLYCSDYKLLFGNMERLICP